MSIPIIAGRDISEFDTDDVTSVAVVSRSFARLHWPGEDPLGRRFNFAFRDRTVSGVVGDIHVRGLESPSEPQVYLPYKQVPDNSIIFYVPKDLVVRSSQDPASLVPDIRRIVREADPELPVSDVQLLADIVDSETALRRTQIMVLAGFAGLSLLLAGIGIHSLLAYGVSQRTGEIGVRIAMGARSQDILQMVVREGIVLASVGSVFGLAAAYAAGRMMEALLAGIQPDDAMTFLAGVGLALAITVTGSLLPALRAARVDPSEALRAD
jgi:ABC-type antimicrobial peptide transport system permease subunit